VTPPPVFRAVLAIAAMCCALSATLAAQKATTEFVPDQTEYQLDPGVTQLIQATVCLPGHPVKADIYVLADITTSMFPVLEQIKANAADIVNALLATSGADIEVGLGYYRDFPFDAKPFGHQVSPTKNTASLVAAINTWIPAGGGDVSEGQFYALYRLATDPAIGFRPDAKRIILWFGDSPAHDPICSIFNGFGIPTFPIDEALVKASLANAGPGGTAVIAISTPTSQLFPQALNDNPKAASQDYAVFCSIGGDVGQADHIAVATGGINTSVTDPPQVVTAILDTVNALLVTADVACEGIGKIMPFIKTITPTHYDDILLPGSAELTTCVTFDILLEGPPCAKKGQIFEGSLDISLNGTPLASQPLKLKQPSCNPFLGTLWIGPRRIEPPVQIPNGGPTDLLQILPTYTQGDVELESLLPLSIPNVPQLVGLELFCQTALFDGKDFPSDPIKVSNGLIAKIGVDNGGVTFGVQSGLALSLNHIALPGGSLALNCVVLP
jgi:hypothetical protein